MDKINDICEYRDSDQCCHPDLGDCFGTVDINFCIKCKFRKAPIREKAISLLVHLCKAASNVGHCLYDTSHINKLTEDEKIYKEQLLNTLRESKLFLESIGVNLDSTS